MSAVSELVRYRFLFEQMVRRELRQKYQGSVLGIAWYVVNPLILMGAYYLVFAVALKPGFAHEAYPLFLLVGLTVWIFFSQSLLAASSSLLDQGALIRKARFPRETIPAATVVVQLVTFLVVLAIVAVLTVAVRGTLDAPLVLLPVVLLALTAFVVGVALLVSVLHAYYRDVGPILGAVLLPWFFVSPIFFAPADIVHSDLARDALTWLNPVAPFIIALRDVLYGGVWPSLGTMAYVLLAALLAMAAGLAVFRRMSAELAVVV
ncbi:MAG: type transporter [Solirubrobacterales bacterium]|jgi:ABC-type polysaccharide/polyol phosphate export permease|nr:type transporter [Solirubrobacterales bacterium]